MPLIAALCAALAASNNKDDIVLLSKEILNSCPFDKKGHILVLHSALGSEVIRRIVADAESQFVIMDGSQEEEATHFFDYQSRSVLALATSSGNQSATRVPSMFRSFRQASHKDINLFTDEEAAKDFEHSDLPFPTKLLQPTENGMTCHNNNIIYCKCSPILIFKVGTPYLYTVRSAF